MRRSLNTLKNMTIRGGAHTSKPGDLSNPSKVNVCIMEAISYIRHGVVDDTPPCVSPAITEVMISRNDSRKTNKQRDRLKVLVRDIINTVPTKTTTSLRGGRLLLVPDHDNIKFINAEHERNRILSESSRFEDPTWGTVLELGEAVPKLSDREFNKLVRRLADVGHFNNNPEPLA